MKQPQIYRKFPDRSDIDYTKFNSGKTPDWLLNYNEKLIVYYYYLYIHSINTSYKYFDNLANKLYLHYDWEIVFKIEIESTIRKIERNAKKSQPARRLYLFSLLNSKNLIEVDEYEKTDIEFEKFCTDLQDKTNFSSFCKDEEYVKRLQAFNLLPEKKSSVHQIDYFVESIDSILKMSIDGCRPTIEEIELYIPNFHFSVKCYSLFYYIFFLKTKLRKKEFDFYQIETSHSFIDQPSYNEYFGYGIVENYAYEWLKNSRTLEDFYTRLLPELVEVSISDFKEIFSKKPVQLVTPIKTKFTTSELIILLEEMMKNKFIPNESRFNLQRLSACFRMKNGKLYKNVSSVKSQLKKQDFTSTYNVLDAGRIRAIKKYVSIK